MLFRVPHTGEIAGKSGSFRLQMNAGAEKKRIWQATSSLLIILRCQLEAKHDFFLYAMNTLA
ncbi:MAG: hypothetical protein Q8S26_08495 [Azonexus sp.]|nr:hypothetical protein [Azonexus sp.]